jgi:predicted metal-binding membrane protein
VACVAWAGSFGHTELPDLRGAALLLPVLGWTLMIVAMMLPTALPLIDRVRVMMRGRPEQVVALLVGYVGVWVGVGVVLHAGDLGVHAAVDRSTFLSDHDWLIPAATFATAGAFQFSAVKYRCLEMCRSPQMFLAQHWRSAASIRQSLAVGAAHGKFCVGCCWALMLVMFAVSVGNLAWMLVLGVLMALERTASWGRRLSAPVGWWLLTCGVGTAFVGLAS